MELILIDPTKLKIMLTAPDLIHYELMPGELEHMSCADQRTRTVFKHIFDDAEAQIGFHTEGERLLVQLFTSKCGGCEIFVTKLGSASPISGDTASHVSTVASALTPAEEALIRRVLDSNDDILQEEFSEVTDPMCEAQHHTFSYAHEGLMSHDTQLRPVILTVDNLHTLIAVCRRLKSVGYAGCSRAYIDSNRTPTAYALCLEVPDGIFYLLPEAYAFLKEYGTISKHHFSEMYLIEYGHILCSDKAVETLSIL